MSEVIPCIDPGTANSLAAVWREGETQLVPNALGEFLTPSIVALNDNREILMGTNKTTHLGKRGYSIYL
jgi:molecular chaperone HscC